MDFKLDRGGKRANLLSIDNRNGYKNTATGVSEANKEAA
jgi:hypothetical protein